MPESGVPHCVEWAIACLRSLASRAITCTHIGQTRELSLDCEQQILAHRALLPDGWASDVEVEVDGAGRIAGVRSGVPAAAGIPRILLPALPNLHSHTFQRAMAGMTEQRADGRDSFWSWRTLMYRFLEKLTPEQIEAIANLAFVEMQEAGFASVAEFHYIHHQPGGTPYENIAETSERIFAAATETGIGLTHLPVLYGFGGAGGAPLSGGQLRFGNDPDRFEELVDAARGRVSAMLAPDARLGVAPHSLRAVDPRRLGAFAERHSAGPIHIHIAEQPTEVAEISDWLGARPVEWLLDNVAVGPGWSLVHATHITPAETEAMARSGAVAGLCPITEANLGDGTFNGPPFLEAGGSFGVGSDSNVRIAANEELRTLEYSQRLRDGARNVLGTGPGSVGRSLYQRAAEGGARALGRDCGAISGGMLADLVTLDSTHVAFAGLSSDQLLDGWIFAAGENVVRDLWSAGRHTVRDGRHTARDEIEGRYRRAVVDLVSSI